MVVACQFNQWPVRGSRVTRQLPSGSTLVFTETTNITVFCFMAYDVELDQQPIGKILVTEAGENTRQEVWHASTDGLHWSPSLPNQNAALDALMFWQACC